MKNVRYFFGLALLALVLLNGFEAEAQRRNKAPLVRLGFRAGFNMSDLTSAKGLDIYNGLAYFDEQLNYIGFTDTKPFKYGFNVGFAGQAQLSDSWFLQGNLILTTKGYKLFTQNVEIDAAANYLQIPIDVMYKYELSDDWRVFASAGAFFGVGLFGFTDFEDHYGENEKPRGQHLNANKPSLDPEMGAHNLICFDPTVHGQVYWKDKDDTFASKGTLGVDAGLQFSLGAEYKSFQLMLTYQYSLTPLYDYNKNFKERYEAKGMEHSTAFEYFDIAVPSSPHQHLISISLSYFLDNWQHGIRW
ncbi:MAG: outer membrane beta-barrel protein [Bacteroidales bacterium]|jgi:hypothetical protein|nr:outer membrane beta-barrel protein [Bacteroidales bacterium]MEE1096801.1 outer membrane beta-barrel protein [Bacteroidales bacterium]